MTISINHPLKAFSRQTDLKDIILSIGEGRLSDAYDLNRKRRYTAFSELNKLLGNRRAIRDALQLKYDAELQFDTGLRTLSENPGFMEALAEAAGVGERPANRQQAIMSAVRNPQRITNALAAIANFLKSDGTDTFYGARVRHELIASTFCEICLLANRQVDNPHGTLRASVSRLEEHIERLNRQTDTFLFRAMQLVASEDGAQLATLSRSYLADAEDAIIGYATLVYEQHLLKTSGPLNKRLVQLLLNGDDCLRNFICSLASATSLATLAYADASTPLLRKYARASRELPFSFKQDNGTDIEIGKIAQEGEFVEIYGVVKSCRVFREGPSKVVTAFVVEDFARRHSIEVTAAYRNLLRYSLAEGCPVNVNGETYSSEGSLKIRARQIPYAELGKAGWKAFLQKEHVHDFQPSKSGLQCRWLNNLQGPGWMNEVFETYRDYRK